VGLAFFFLNKNKYGESETPDVISADRRGRVFFFFLYCSCCLFVCLFVGLRGKEYPFFVCSLFCCCCLFFLSFVSPPPVLLKLERKSKQEVRMHAKIRQNKEREK
jgi:hypothetical protein